MGCSPKLCTKCVTSDAKIQNGRLFWGATSLTSGRHGNCLHKCNFHGNETNCGGGKKISMGKRNNVWSAFTHSHHPSWLLNCEHCHWLSLSWAGIKLEQSFLPTSVHVLAKKKQMFGKFCRWKIHHDGCSRCKLWQNVQRLVCGQ